MSEKFDVYKLAVEMADRVSSRRMVANGFFLSVQTALVGILAFSYDKFTEDLRLVLVIIAIIGILLSLTWLFALRSYRHLIKIKYNEINKMEAGLDTRYTRDEWAALKRTTDDDAKLKGLRNWWIKSNDRYTELSSIEGVVPVIFSILYIVILFGIIFRVGA